MLVLTVAHPDFIESIELKTYDLRMRLISQSNEYFKDIAIITIDDDSINKLGRWPWPRSLFARVIDFLSKNGATLVGLNIIFSEPEENTGLKEIRDLIRFVEESRVHNSDSNADPFLKRLVEAEIRLDNDAKLVQAVRSSNNVVLPVFFKLGLYHEQKRGKLSPKESVIERFSLPFIREESPLFVPFQAKGVTLPIPPLVEASRGLGHLNLDYDIDGKTRRDALIVDYKGYYFPSYPLQMAMSYLGLTKNDVEVVPGIGIMLGSQLVPTDISMGMLIRYAGLDRAFPRYSFFDVINGKITPDAFKDKIVLIGTTAAGIYTPVSTPIGNNMPAVEISANVISNLVNQDFILRPDWVFFLELGLLLLLGAYISVVMPRLKANVSALTTLAFFALVSIGGTLVFVLKGIWLKLTYPILQLVIGYTLITSRRFLSTEEAKTKVEGESIETNKMLGLSFQGQGMLDMAFEKFRKCPVDDEMKDLLYNLALDFERKRMINKAVAVYEYIQRHDKNYKNINERIKTLSAAEASMMLGSPGGASEEGLLSTIITEGSSAKPTLGRYEIIEELGKGAMGMVYKGKDPKINRVVAIKTIRFSDNFDPEQIEEMRERFYREAETAGRLSHPNIVTIYDVGEDYDLAYISMEFLEGEDLEKYCKKGNLLPIRKVIHYMEKICDALDYAHKNNIVHRDIKPANIMLLKDGTIKVTDFGIARITTSSKTQTGVVLGTPNYMSPEQAEGKRVDGRSDIFSLGVVFYQLLTGELPFKGETIASLMYQITHAPHPSPKKFNPRIPSACVAIIDKALEKDVKKRYQTAGAFGRHLALLGKKMDQLASQKMKKQAS